MHTRIALSVPVGESLSIYLLVLSQVLDHDTGVPVSFSDIDATVTSTYDATPRQTLRGYQAWTHTSP